MSEFPQVRLLRKCERRSDCPGRPAVTYDVHLADGSVVSDLSRAEVASFEKFIRAAEAQQLNVQQWPAPRTKLNKYRWAAALSAARTLETVEEKK
jgi:hypothetical protein